MKIYTVSKSFGGKIDIYSIEVRETEKMYIADHSISEFGHSNRFWKKDCCLTPKEAILEYRNMLLTRKGNAQDRLDRAKMDLTSLEILGSGLL